MAMPLENKFGNQNEDAYDKLKNEAESVLKEFLLSTNEEEALRAKNEAFLILTEMQRLNRIKFSQDIKPDNMEQKKLQDVIREYLESAEKMIEEAEEQESIVLAENARVSFERQQENKESREKEIVLGFIEEGKDVTLDIDMIDPAFVQLMSKRISAIRKALLENRFDNTKKLKIMEHLYKKVLEYSKKKPTEKEELLNEIKNSFGVEFNRAKNQREVAEIAEIENKLRFTDQLENTTDLENKEVDEKKFEVVQFKTLDSLDNKLNLINKRYHENSISGMEYKKELRSFLDEINEYEAILKKGMELEIEQGLMGVNSLANNHLQQLKFNVENYFIEINKKIPERQELNKTEIRKMLLAINLAVQMNREPDLESLYKPSLGTKIANSKNEAGKIVELLRSLGITDASRNIIVGDAVKKFKDSLTEKEKNSYQEMTDRVHGITKKDRDQINRTKPTEKKTTQETLNKVNEAWEKEQQDSRNSELKTNLDADTTKPKEALSKDGETKNTYGVYDIGLIVAKIDLSRAHEAWEQDSRNSELKTNLDNAKRDVVKLILDSHTTKPEQKQESVRAFLTEQIQKERRVQKNWVEKNVYDRAKGFADKWENFDKNLESKHAAERITRVAIKRTVNVVLLTGATYALAPDQAMSAFGRRLYASVGLSVITEASSAKYKKFIQKAVAVGGGAAIILLSGGGVVAAVTAAVVSAAGREIAQRLAKKNWAQNLMSKLGLNKAPNPSDKEEELKSNLSAENLEQDLAAYQEELKTLLEKKSSENLRKMVIGGVQKIGLQILAIEAGSLAHETVKDFYEENPAQENPNATEFNPREISKLSGVDELGALAKTKAGAFGPFENDYNLENETTTEDVLARAKSVENSPVDLDAIIHKETNGITFVFKQQIEADPSLGQELAEQIGYKGGTNSPQFYKALGEKFGYINEKGDWIGVRGKGGDTAYQFEKQGDEYVVVEYHKEGADWVQGDIHNDEGKFEGKGFDKKYEYLNKAEKEIKLENDTGRVDRVIEGGELKEVEIKTGRPTNTENPEEEVTESTETTEEERGTENANATAEENEATTETESREDTSTENTPENKVEVEPYDYKAGDDKKYEKDDKSWEKVYVKTIEKPIKPAYVWAGSPPTETIYEPINMDEFNLWEENGVAKFAEINGYDFTAGTYEELTEKNNSDIKEIFGKDMEQWYGTKGRNGLIDQPATNLMNYEVNAIDNNKNLLTVHMRMLYEETGLKPYDRGDVFNMGERADEYIIRTKLELASQGKLDTFETKWQATLDKIISEPATEKELKLHNKNIEKLFPDYDTRAGEDTPENQALEKLQKEFDQAYTKSKASILINASVSDVSAYKPVGKSVAYYVREMHDISGLDPKANETAEEYIVRSQRTLRIHGRLDEAELQKIPNTWKITDKIIEAEAEKIESIKAKTNRSAEESAEEPSDKEDKEDGDTLDYDPDRETLPNEKEANKKSSDMKDKYREYETSDESKQVKKETIKPTKTRSVKDDYRDYQ